MVHGIVVGGDMEIFVKNITNKKSVHGEWSLLFGLLNYYNEDDAKKIYHRQIKVRAVVTFFFTYLTCHCDI